MNIINESRVGDYLASHDNGKFNVVCSVTYNGEPALAGPVQAYSYQVGPQNVQFATSDLLSFFKDMNKNIGKADPIVDFQKVFKEDSDIIFAQLLYSAYYSMKALHDLGVLQLDGAARNFLLVPTKIENGIPVKFAVVVTDFGRSQIAPDLKVTGLTQNPPIIWSNCERLEGNASINTDLWSQRILLYEFIAAATGDYKNAFSQIVCNPNPEKIEFIDPLDPRKQMRTVEAVGSLPIQVGTYVLKEREDKALTTFYSQATSYLNQPDMVTQHPHAARLLQSFAPYLDPKGATQKEDQMGVNDMTAEKDEAMLRSGFKDFMQRTAAAKLQTLISRLNDNTYNKAEAIRNFANSCRMLKELESDARVNLNLIKELNEFLNKLLRMVKERNINLEEIKEDPFVQTSQDILEEQLLNQVNSIVIDYGDQLQKTKSFLKLSKPQLSDLKNLNEDAFRISFEAAKILEKQILDAQKLYGQTGTLLSAFQDIQTHISELSNDETTIWNRFQARRAELIKVMYGNLFDEYKEISKQNMDRITFAKSLNLLRSIYRARSELYKAEIDVDQSLDFKAELNRLTGESKKNPETLVPILDEFQTILSRSKPPHPLSQVLKEIRATSVDKEQLKTQPSAIDSGRESQHPAINLVRTLQSIMMTSGKPNKIKMNIQFSRELLKGTANISTLSNVLNNFIVLSNGLGELLKAKLECEKTGKKFDLDEMLAMAALYGEDVSQIKTYAKEMLEIVDKELPQIKEDIKNTRDAITHLSKKRTVSDASPMQMKQDSGGIEEVKSLYEKRRQYVDSIKSFVNFFCNEDGSLKEDKVFLEGKSLSTIQRAKLEFFLQPYRTLAKLVSALPDSVDKHAVEEILYSLVYQDPLYSEALKKIAMNQSNFIRFINEDIGRESRAYFKSIEIQSTKEKTNISHPLTADSELKLSVSSIVNLPVQHTNELIAKMYAIEKTEKTSELSVLIEKAKPMLREETKELSAITKKSHNHLIPSIIKEQKLKMKILRGILFGHIDQVCSDKNEANKVKKFVIELTKYGLDQAQDDIGILRLTKINEILAGLQTKNNVNDIRSYVQNKVANDKELNSHRDLNKTEDSNLVIHLKKFEGEFARGRSGKKGKLPVFEKALPAKTESKKPETPKPDIPKELTPAETLREMIKILDKLIDAIDKYQARALAAAQSNTESSLKNESNELQYAVPTGLVRDVNHQPTVNQTNTTQLSQNPSEKVDNDNAYKLMPPQQTNYGEIPVGKQENPELNQTSTIPNPPTKHKIKRPVQDDYHHLMPLAPHSRLFNNDQKSTKIINTKEENGEHQTKKDVKS